MRRSKGLGRPAKKRPYNSDRKLREMIFRTYANAEYAPGGQVMGMQAIFLWIKSGDVPNPIEQIRGKAPVAKLVPKNDPK